MNYFKFSPNNPHLQGISYNFIQTMSGLYLHLTSAHNVTLYTSHYILKSVRVEQLN